MYFSTLKTNKIKQANNPKTQTKIHSLQKNKPKPKKKKKKEPNTTKLYTHI